jgi:hypothetical protein
MKLKLFEILDRKTAIYMFAFRARSEPTLEVERYILSRGGYGPSNESDCVVLGYLSCPTPMRGCTYDPHAWGGRTLPVAHAHIAAHWDSLASGDVIDVEFILGETAAPKLSERLEDPV